MVGIRRDLEAGLGEIDGVIEVRLTRQVIRGHRPAFKVDDRDLCRRFRRVAYRPADGRRYRTALAVAE